MKYLIQIYSNPESRAMWETFTAEQQAEGYAYYQGINDELAASGEFVASEALADISLAKRVTKALAEHHRTWAVRAHLLERAGSTDAASLAFAEAARRTLNGPEQRYLAGKAETLRISAG